MKNRFQKDLPDPTLRLQLARKLSGKLPAIPQPIGRPVDWLRGLESYEIRQAQILEKFFYDAAHSGNADRLHEDSFQTALAAASPRVRERIAMFADYVEDTGRNGPFQHAIAPEKKIAADGLDFRTTKAVADAAATLRTKDGLDRRMKTGESIEKLESRRNAKPGLREYLYHAAVDVSQDAAIDRFAEDHQDLNKLSGELDDARHGNDLDPAFRNYEAPASGSVREAVENAVISHAAPE